MSAPLIKVDIGELTERERAVIKCQAKHDAPAAAEFGVTVEGRDLFFLCAFHKDEMVAMVAVKVH